MSKQRYPTLFLTDRSLHHQESARRAAPPELDLIILRRPQRADLLKQLTEIEILISERADVIDAEVIAAAPRLQLIQRLGSLTHDIDLAAATARGIAVCYWPIRGCIMVAEHMVMQMLALVKRLPDVTAIAATGGDWGHPSQRTDENTFAYNWSGREAIEGIFGRTVGILGFGEIGVELAHRLQPFQPKQILYHRRQRLPDVVETGLGIRYVEPSRLIPQADFLCSLLPYTSATDQSINDRTMQQMKPGAFLVSCGSGSVVDEHALAAALQRGHLAGAALDTFEWEPLRADNPLLPLARHPSNNLILTPHTAAGAPRNPDEFGRQNDYGNIIRYLKGAPLLNCLTPLASSDH